MIKRAFLAAIILFSANLLFSKDLPLGYGGITLGMTLDETKSALIKNSDFGYHGDRDVSLMPDPNQTLIETDAESGHGSPFLADCMFQFYADKLYIITINVNTKKMDYYSMFKHFSEKYGNPLTLDPQRSTWKNDTTTIILEKPLSVRYIDNKTYEDLKNYTNIQKSGEEKSRELFLEEF